MVIHIRLRLDIDIIGQHDGAAVLDVFRFDDHIAIGRGHNPNPAVKGIAKIDIHPFHTVDTRLTGRQRASFQRNVLAAVYVTHIVINIPGSLYLDIF
ncbi:hypothetical protein D3C75_719160 [compost metagenome]